LLLASIGIVDYRYSTYEVMDLERNEQSCKAARQLVDAQPSHDVIVVHGVKSPRKYVAKIMLGHMSWLEGKVRYRSRYE
jgi:hypothetical protein